MKTIGSYQINMTQHLGKGVSGSVFAGIDTKKPDKKLAVKIISKQSMEEDQFIKSAYQSQINIMTKLRNENIIQLIAVEESAKNYYIIMELASNGTLRDLLKKDGRYPQKIAIKLIIQLLNGFGQLVKHGIIHRDLKPENILVGDNQRLKIGDFGLSKCSPNNSSHRSVVGTPVYMSPQILSGSRYSYKCDIWALGVLAYELVFGIIPWSRREATFQRRIKQILQQQLSFPLEVQCSQNMKSFINGCLRIQQSSRLDWNQVYEHPLFQGIFNQKFNFILQNERMGSIKVKFILSDLRMLIHSNNINVNKILSKWSSDQLSKEEFALFLLCLDRRMEQQNIVILYNYLQQNDKVRVMDFQQLLVKQNCRLTGLDNEKIKKSSNSHLTYEAIISIKNVLHNTAAFSLRDHLNKVKTMIKRLTLEQFTYLIFQIQPRLTPQHAQNLFRQFNVRQERSISLEDYCVTLCKISEEGFQPMEIQ